mmetsp:Transcript_10894/g.28586  ORF Transcript_10894/g.28586 Transcript_10894/m.28586 type:complete len:474 (-) Transcript_10894:455-1876(-)
MRLAGVSSIFQCVRSANRSLPRFIPSPSPFPARLRASASATSMNPIELHPISLNELEQKILSFLRTVTAAKCPTTTVRVAGGWVRDKLLGLDSDDLDIALDNMMGMQFTELIHQHLKEEGREGDASNTGLIKANPEQSKHLETATLRLFGQMIDFVNLRSEEYSESSRIPTIRIGTPSEDAYRRDFTMNALFYNVTEEKVEDLTKRGVDDLRNRLVRTPLPPHTTLLDDPLRVMRAVRFASRYAFSLDADLSKSMKEAEIKSALAEKVSKERIGVELDKMISGRYPAHSVWLLHDHDLIEGVLFPKELLSSAVEGTPDGLSFSAFDTVRKSLALAMRDDIEVTKGHLRILMLASLFSPLSGCNVPFGKKGKEEPLPKVAIREAMKLPNRDAEGSMKILQAADRFTQVLKGEVEKTRKNLGMVLRQIGEYWYLGLLIIAAKKCSLPFDFNHTSPCSLYHVRTVAPSTFSLSLCE